MGAVVHRPGEGDALFGGRIVIKSGLDQLCITESHFRKAQPGAEPHYHERHADSFYVLEGELEFHVGDEVIRGSVGTYVLAPPGVVHFFRNVSDEPARALNLHAPGGFVEYRRELLALQARGVEPDHAFFEQHDVFDV
jgi:quercetin dioxygenase-like cupin family protein